MANNTIGWGQGATNNNIGWGRGSSNDIGWGSVYDSSYVGDTDIVGGDTRFIIRIDTTQAGSAADTFVLPWVGTYDVDWGDGNVDLAVTNTQTHVYASSGIYDVKVTAATGQIYFNNGGDKSKLIDIRNWGNVGWTSMNAAFYGCSNTIVSAEDALVLPDNCFLMFTNCSSINTLEVSNWDTSSVTSMGLMFLSCTSLTTLDVSGWDTSSVTSMSGMFQFCSNLTTLDVSSWDTSSATNMSVMFYFCGSLKADLSGLDIASVTNLTNFAAFTNINDTGTTTNYDNTLISWEAQAPTSGISISFGNSKYSWRAIEARNTLVNTYNWTITDGGFDDVSDEFIFSVDTNVAGTSGIGNFQLPLVSSGTIDVIVDWGDGTSDNITTYNQTETLHSYSTAGEYQIKISSRVAGVNPIKGWSFNNTGDRLKMLNIFNWGNFDVSVDAGFWGCENLTQTALDSPSLSSTSLLRYFRQCLVFNGDVGNWDISGVSALNFMLYNADSFNQDLSGWDITSAINFDDFMTAATGLSTTNYDATLIAWEANLQTYYPAGSGYTASININFGGSKFTLGSAAEAARTSLQVTYSWTLVDGGPA